MRHMPMLMPILGARSHPIELHISFTSEEVMRFRRNLSTRKGIREVPLASPACKSNRLL
jgi:hypothetical protein